MVHVGKKFQECWNETNIDSFPHNAILSDSRNSLEVFEYFTHIRIRTSEKKGKANKTRRKTVNVNISDGMVKLPSWQKFNEKLFRREYFLSDA